MSLVPPDANLPTPVPRVCVVIPAYRAARTIRTVLVGLPSFVQHVIVVDDASDDETSKAANDVGDARLVLLRHEVNQGVGGATWSGYQEAIRLKADIVVKMDSDGQMDPAWLVPLIMPVWTGRADYAKGNRFLHSRELDAMPLLRRVGNTGLSFLVKIASGCWGVFDPANGYTAISTHALRHLDSKRVGRRYFFETSLLIELGLARAVVEDVHIPARYGNEASGLSEVGILLQFPPRLFAAAARRIWIQHLVRDFGLLAVFLITGLCLATFGAAFGSYHWYHSLIAGVGAPGGTVMIAALCLVLGLQCLLQAVLLDVQSQPKEPLSHRQNVQREVLESLQRA